MIRPLWAGVSSCTRSPQMISGLLVLHRAGVAMFSLMASGVFTLFSIMRRKVTQSQDPGMEKALKDAEPIVQELLACRLAMTQLTNEVNAGRVCACRLRDIAATSGRHTGGVVRDVCVPVFVPQFPHYPSDYVAHGVSHYVSYGLMIGPPAISPTQAVQWALAAGCILDCVCEDPKSAMVVFARVSATFF